MAAAKIYVQSDASVCWETILKNDKPINLWGTTHLLANINTNLGQTKKLSNGLLKRNHNHCDPYLLSKEKPQIGSTGKLG